jgi:hypothetical protein
MAPAKVVSVSLFGRNKKYIRGAQKLANSILKNLPEWRLVFFVGNSVPLKIKNALIATNATLIMVNEAEDLSAAAWRFRTWELGNPDYVIFRDSDSIVSSREARAVVQWVESGMVAHIIRDHPLHSAKILAGLWGLRPKETEWFAEEVKGFNFLDTYGSDQEFLANSIYPRISTKSMVHASFHKHEPAEQIADFTKGSSRLGAFCGESITENIVIRTYARVCRLVAKKACKCEK